MNQYQPAQILMARKVFRLGFAMFVFDVEGIITKRDGDKVIELLPTLTLRYVGSIAQIEEAIKKDPAPLTIDPDTQTVIEANRMTDREIIELFQFASSMEPLLPLIRDIRLDDEGRDKATRERIRAGLRGEIATGDFVEDAKRIVTKTVVRLTPENARHDLKFLAGRLTGFCKRGSPDFGVYGETFHALMLRMGPEVRKSPLTAYVDEFCMNFRFGTL